MKINFKDNKTKLILFFIITGWLRVLMIVIPGVWIYMNTGEWREQTNNQEQVITEPNDNIPTLTLEQRNRFSTHRFTNY